MAKKNPKSNPRSKSTPGKKSGPTLASLRRQIDKLDRQIVEAINARARLAQEVGELKYLSGDAIYAPDREQQVIETALERNRGPLPDESVRAVIRELISGSRAIEKRIHVAFLGPEFSYSHLAAIHRFGQSVDLIPVHTIAAVFEEVQRGHADFGLVPVENSTDGRVSDTLEMFEKARVQLCGEVPLRIHHNLLGIGNRQEIREVYSKPQALSQCRNWIAKHLPDARPVEVTSTSDAARRAGKSKQTAAVASIQAATNYQLKVLARNIEDNLENLTRFAVIGEHCASRTGDDKTSLMFEVDHRPGALADAMTIFKRNRLNMTWIESFPIPQSPGRYLFFVEFVGHQDDLRARRAIASLEKKAVRLEILGSYARMDPID